jgi:hypothetical protein
MAEGPQLTEAERVEIGKHAQRVAAYMKLRALVQKWRAELELQDKANYIVARVLGGLVALAAVGVALYLAFQIYEQLAALAFSPIAASRKASWYLAALTLTFTAFSFGSFYAIWSMPKHWYFAAVGAIPVAGLLFVVGLLVAPFIAWLVAS